MAEKEDIALGFVEEIIDPDDFGSLLFPSKVGGRPVWLDPANLLAPEAFLCGQCRDPMHFVLQVYAPKKAHPESYHRMLYLFVCKKGACNNAPGSVLVLRCQLGRDNPFYNREGDRGRPKGEPAKTCDLCGVPANKSCSKCHAIKYCSRQHQVADWRCGHKDECAAIAAAVEAAAAAAPAEGGAGGADGSKAEASRTAAAAASLVREAKPTRVWGKTAASTGRARSTMPALTPELVEARSKQLFPEYQVLSEPEELNETDLARKVKELAKEQQERMESGADAEDAVPEEEDDFDEDTFGKNPQVDDVFINFQARVEQNPEQCLRYAAVPGQEPLWVRKPERLSDDKVPPCELCGGKRSFELQVLPQMLYYLLQHEGSEDDCVDWGTIVVYTCDACCSLPTPAEGLKPAYVAEYGYRQQE